MCFHHRAHGRSCHCSCDIHSVEKKSSCGLKPKVMSSSGHAANTKCTVVRSASTCPICCAAVFPVSSVAAPFRGCAHHSPGRRVPHRDEQHGKEDVKEDVVPPDLSQAEVRAGDGRLGRLGVIMTDKDLDIYWFSIYNPTGSPYSLIPVLRCLD